MAWKEEVNVLLTSIPVSRLESMVDLLVTYLYEKLFQFLVCLVFSLEVTKECTMKDIGYNSIKLMMRYKNSPVNICQYRDFTFR